ncbi:S60 ribosomal protein L27 [Heterostelium album PN500]|uniref:60S ribosomal protein L27 n=1 Tax=Heterostelium pallidum (strain ATCC 26659 / Pp 5 / PN500) TaxID=670386 RepID=D3BK76_HETP5|nr:S60 ribosomal protein L27 [Heterostelium album PN500]EFA78306.1 S60 ribosomal protein L27 [Heterostelium album PN500]|eukprot:XP_020430431.1 S60 ribosomal protein L27 [Heterostelium album PN500]
MQKLDLNDFSLPFDEPNKERPYGHCLVAGIDKYPRRIVRKMSRKVIMKRIAIRPFVKVVNYNHIMPTRYNFETREENSFNGIKESVTMETAKPAKRLNTKYAVKKIFQDKYKAGKSKWFFTKLRF